MHFITSLLFSIAACGEDSAAPEPATEEMTDVEDIPVPSEDKEEDENEDSQSTDEPDPEQPAETLSYNFSDGDSLLYVQVYKDPSALGANLSHNHVMRAANFSGQMSYNRDDISECELNFLVPVNDLRVDEAAMRSYVGYNDTINDGDRATIREHMLSNGQLNSSTYTTITFNSTGCQENGDSLLVSGEFTLRGVTKQITLDLDFSVSGDRVYFSGEHSFNHSDHGFQPYEAFGGFVRNDQPLDITFDMVGFEN